MMELGFDLGQSEEALRAAGGNLNLAIARLRGQTEAGPRRAGHERGASFSGERGRSAHSGEFSSRVYQVEAQEAAHKRHSVTHQYLRNRLRKGAHLAEHGLDFVDGVRHDAAAHRHTAMDKHNPLPQSPTNATAWEPERSFRTSWGGKGVVEELTTSRGRFTEAQLQKMETAADLYSNYLPSDHAVLEQLNTTLSGTEPPLDHSDEEEWAQPLNRTSTGDTSEEEEAENGENDEWGQPKPPGPLDGLEPSRYYQQRPSSALTNMRAAHTHRLSRPGTAPAASKRRHINAGVLQRPSQVMSSQRPYNNYGERHLISTRSSMASASASRMNS